MIIKNYWVEILNASSVRYGRGPLRVQSWTNTSLLSASGEFTFDVSAADPNISVLAEKRVAVCKYIGADGVLRIFGGGVIDKITATIAEDGSLMYHVVGNDLARELTYRNVGALALTDGAGAGVLDSPEQIMALAPSGWSITGGTTDAEIYVGFDGETVLAALARVGERAGEHWRLGTNRVIEWLGPSSGFSASGVRAIQHVNDPIAAEALTNIVVVTSLEELSDSADLVTRVIPRGSGTGNVVLTLATATDTPPSGYVLDAAENYVKRTASETTYGRIERVLDFKDIGPLSNSTADMQAAANTLMRASVEHLRRYGQPCKFYELGLANVNVLLQPGTLLPVQYRVLLNGAVVKDINETLIIVSVDNTISAEGAHTSSVQVATIDRLPLSDADYLAVQSLNATVLSTHQQLGPSVDTMTYRDEMDNSHGASMRFWLGEEYTSIQRAVLRFRIQPMRSTIKNAAGQGTTTSAGGGSTSGSGGGSTSGSGGAGTHTASDEISWSYVNTTLDIASGANHYHGIGATMHTHPVYIPNHTHSVPAHTHSTPDHTHYFTPAISVTYGIYEESGANTLALADLVIKLNSGADLRSAVVDIGGGWYELDFSDDLVDAAFRPTQESNTIDITSAVAKTARIEAQITIRGVVQAVNYD